MTFGDVVSLTLIATTVATMPLHAIIARGRPSDPDMARRGNTILLGKWIRDWFVWLIGPLERALVGARVSPAHINALGALLGGGAGVAFGAGMLATAGWMLLAIGAADVLDGRIARARNVTSDFGAFIDSTLDRFAECFTFLGLVVFFAKTPAMVFATTVAMSGSLLVSYTRARGETLRVQSTGGVMQRAERLVMLAVGAIIDSWVGARMSWPAGTVLAAAIFMTAAGTWATAAWRFITIANVLHRRRSLTAL